MKFRNIHNQSLTRLLLLYTLLVTGISVFFPAVYALLYPETASELVGLLKNAITSGFNMDAFKKALPGNVRDDITAVAFTVLALHAFAIIVLNMIFPAVIVAKLIRPDVNIRTSRGAAYDPYYGLKQSPHILFRLVNASAFDLYGVILRAFLVVHHEDPQDRTKEMIYYFPIDDMDPLEIPVLKSHYPWIVAIPVDTTFSNSIVHNYEIRPAEESGSRPGRRGIEVLISGNEIEASTEFMKAVKISIESGGADGMLCGRFESLPTIMNKSELKLIDVRHLANEENEARCKECRHKTVCRFLKYNTEAVA